MPISHQRPDPPVSPADKRAIQQEVAADLIEMIKRHHALNQQEHRLMESIIAEVGTKYGILPPEEGYKIDRIEERIPREWF